MCLGAEDGRSQHEGLLLRAANFPVNVSRGDSEIFVVKGA